MWSRKQACSIISVGEKVLIAWSVLPLMNVAIVLLPGAEPSGLPLERPHTGRLKTCLFRSMVIAHSLVRPKRIKKLISCTALRSLPSIPGFIITPDTATPTSWYTGYIVKESMFQTQKIPLFVKCDPANVHSFVLGNWPIFAADKLNASIFDFLSALLVS